LATKGDGATITKVTRIEISDHYGERTLATKGGCAAILEGHERGNFVTVVFAKPSW
jgi:hypothetical protein